MANNTVLLDHSGDFSHDTIDSLLKKVKKDLKEHNVENVVTKKVYYILVEMIENIQKHSKFEKKVADPKWANRVKLELIEINDEKGFVIGTSNIIKNKDMVVLKTKLDEYNNQNLKNQKKLHKTIIDESTDISDRGGAGLGLLDITIRSQSKLHYNFTPIDKDYSYYDLQVKFMTKLDTKKGFFDKLKSKLKH